MKRSPSSDSLQDRKVPRKRRGAKRKEKEVEPEWPAYFDSLFKIYKALNTVLAFVSSRKHLAVTFTVVRSSVERILQQPLELTKVAEIKALLPDLINFAYIPHNDVRINGDVQDHGKASSSGELGRGMSDSAYGRGLEEEEHVLVLEFAERSKGRRAERPGFDLSLPPALSPNDVKKLIEKRNDRFSQAVNELIRATPASDDPVALLQAAGHDNVPVRPSIGPAAFTSVKANMPVPDWTTRPSVDEVIAEIIDQEWYKQQIVDRRTVQAKPAQLAHLDPPLSNSIVQALKESRKITDLYTHQVAAISTMAKGKNVIVSTSTASGKSVIYQVPLLRFLENDSESTAIFIYPTKALAQDQRAALEQLLWSCPGLQHIKVATYDGDTPQEQRAGIRGTASVIFTNFDMIHMSILPHEDLWRRFLTNLKLVAVDELHYYSGVFGSHVAQVIRRFRRVCAALGNRSFQLVSCSATISNPKQHMENIFGIDNIDVVTEDGAPSGKKDFLVWNPPPIDPLNPRSMGRRSAILEATGLMRFLMKRGIRVILFCKIRRVCELAMKTIRTDLSAEGRFDILDRVMPYRGGYSKQDRRRIEHQAFSGDLLGIIATNALELGVDIGVLDAVIMLGFPSSLASYRQQAGRAGRRARDAMAVLVADSTPIDQHFVQYPHDLYEACTDDLIVDLDSKVILEAHLQCAAQEMPLSPDDELYFGHLTKELCNSQLVKDEDGWYHTHPKFLPFPAKHVNLRGATEEKYLVVDITKEGRQGSSATILEEVEFSRALFELYEGAVFVHQGLTFIVKELQHDTKIAKALRADVSWITTPRDFTDIDPVQTFRIREIKDSPVRAFYGRVDVETTVFGFFKIRNNKILDIVDLDAEPWRRETTGMWIDVPNAILQLMLSKNINLAAAIHAAEHAFLNRFDLATDLGTECKVPEKEFKSRESERKRPARLIFYDSIGKGGGIAAKAFDHAYGTLRLAHEVVESCPCTDGCSKCVQSASCKEDNVVWSKVGAQVILRAVLGLSIDADSVPTQTDSLSTFETVVEAPSVKVADRFTTVESNGS